jgi:hypothetical protein
MSDRRAQRTLSTGRNVGAWVALLAGLAAGCGTSARTKNDLDHFEKAFDESLVVWTTDLPPATVGREFKFNLQARGQPKPYVWKIVSGRLPDGLALDEEGAISGVPTGRETASFVIQVRCKLSPASHDRGWSPHIGSRMRHFTLVVKEPPPSIGRKP